MSRKTLIMVACIIAYAISANAQCPNNEIWYTTTDGKKLENIYLFDGSAEELSEDNIVISHTYTDGKGVIRFGRKLDRIGGDEGDIYFEGQTNLKTIILPNGITYIGFEAFTECTSLTSITIPNSVRWIMHGAFEGCKSLTSITIPNSIEEIDSFAFLNCDNLKTFKGKYASKDGKYLVKDGTLITCISTGVSSFTIPHDVSVIGPHAFYGSSISQIILHDKIVAIEVGAFMRCNNLTNITIPNSVTVIQRDAFAFCSNLTSIVIPDSVKELGSGVFKECRNLKSAVVPSHLEKIPDDIFSKCSSLTDFTIPDSVTEIGYSAFGGCRSLKSITIPNGVTKLGHHAFSTCTSLTEIVIPGSVSKIDEYAFIACSGLKSITIPKGVIKIGQYAFKNCTGKLIIHCPMKWVTLAESLFSEIVFGDEITVLSGDPLYRCYNVESVTIPNSLTFMAKIFEHCRRLKTINIKQVTDNDFQHKSNLPLNVRIRHISKDGSIIDEYTLTH